LIVAPLALGFARNAEGATSNHMLVGMLVGLLALVVLAMHRDDVERARAERDRTAVSDGSRQRTSPRE
jgi:hypothetical protein